MSDERKNPIDRTFLIEGAIMDFHKLTGRSQTGGEAAVGADLSRPSPIYRPPHDHQMHWLKSISSTAYSTWMPLPGAIPAQTM